MTSRRLIRIKVLQLLYAFSKKEGNTIAEGEKDLFKSISKSTDLYYYIFLLITEIQRKAFLKIDAAKNRKAPTREDLNPNTRFIENPVIAQIAGNRKFKTYINANLISLNDTPEIITKLYNHLTELECYKTYMEKTDISYEDHKKMVLDMIVGLIAQDEEFFETMEEKNIFWNDDFDLVLSIVYKTIKNMKSNFKEEDLFFIALYNEEEDYDFAKTLFRKTILDKDTNTEIIDKFAYNWEVDRISDMDKLIMSTAITELKYFSSIPVKVTLDEYIEISKSYCSPKSSGFINGVLDKVVTLLKENNEIQKMGRGLME
ncbi:transcription antitermination factor NusB [Gabonibacter chumensis]|uniref:transcription antitermination factor NusB n=1 Tax=Gabonibacter chumensis TaxID=2972474 RepID=UPI0025736FE1|nr:transcription antitermination factor NusB [Gabonibacter chumensis]MCR9012340.1 transcription antitermination factor NusB [Gabonibacter chumensis]